MYLPVAEDSAKHLGNKVLVDLYRSNPLIVI